MKQLWEKISDTIKLAIGLVYIFLFVLVIIPTIPFFLVYSHFSDKAFQKRYNLFLERMDGSRFFCYNSRKSSVEFAKEFVVPELAPSVHIVFVDGQKVDCGADGEYISRMLYSIKERKGFPYLLIIENKEVLELSVNNQFYSVMIGRKPIAPLLDRINLFFSYGALNN